MSENVIRVQVIKEDKSNNSRSLQDIFEWSNVTITNAIRRAKREIFRNDQYDVGEKVILQANDIDSDGVSVREWVKPATWRH